MLLTTLTLLSVVGVSHPLGLITNVPVAVTLCVLPSPTVTLSLPALLIFVRPFPFGVTWQLAPLSAIHISPLFLFSFIEILLFCELVQNKELRNGDESAGFPT